ncbi:2,3-bisphosphoglycerate-dependent phosphoglycerate mutase [Nocardioides sp. BE266]|uniref:histidine phosphatase family protein n=1 Tax=Nocardioides sp. BE266 TaxID=2817725 RepID=UPI00285F1061|nr:histidine phosphatase family protein [Nocardioides sp. BE266]MDR7254749.1 2,3-bisphosphoglycerate-dependent phosphoglycerate mutase [Nocardioides sp. BE266]
MRFVLVRHGQSNNNKLWAETGDETGREVDTRLTPLGEQQAAALASYATEPGLPWRLTHLYASPMVRAVQTAAPLADALDLPLQLHEDLFEVGGPYDLHETSGARVAHPGSGRGALAALSDRLHLPDWVGEDGWWRGEVEGERSAYIARADRLLASLEERHDPGDVVGLVSHGWFGNVLLARLLGVAELDGAFELANASITLVEDTADDVPWGRTAIRVNWLPHLDGTLITDSAIGTT